MFFPLGVTLTVTSLIFWGFINVMVGSTAKQGEMVAEKVRHIAATGIFDVMNSKLDILLDNAGWPAKNGFEIGSNLFTKGWLTAVIVAITLAMSWAAIRKYTRCYFVAFNEFTTARLQRMIKLREYVFWAGVVAFGISVIASLVAGRFDRLVFG